MSKAFTRETDNDDDEEISPGLQLSQGVKNYISPGGHARLKAELDHLLRVERPHVVEVVAWAASNGDRSENGDYIYGKRRLREIDRRIRFLTKRLDIAEVVDPLKQPNRDQVFFGATVTIVDEDSKKKTYTIVGIDEVDTARSWISWISPIGRALLGKKVGDFINVNTPMGEVEYEVESLEYKAIPIPEFKPIGGLK